jgi:hypothetical protein
MGPLRDHDLAAGRLLNVATLHPAFVANDNRQVLLSGGDSAYSEPVYACPYCNGPCEANFVDIGVGVQQCGPFVCGLCGAAETGLHQPDSELTAIEQLTGYYEPPARSEEMVDVKIPFYALVRMPKHAATPAMLTGLWKTYERSLHAEQGKAVTTGLNNIGLEAPIRVGIEDVDYWELHDVDEEGELPF